MGATRAIDNQPQVPKVRQESRKGYAQLKQNEAESLAMECWNAEAAAGAKLTLGSKVREACHLSRARHVAWDAQHLAAAALLLG